MGAVLQTVNIRLSPEQILYTDQPCQGPDVPACAPATSFQWLEGYQGQAGNGPAKFRADRRPGRKKVAEFRCRRQASYEAMVAAGSPGIHLPPIFERENTPRDDRSNTTGTTGSCRKGVYFSPPSAGAAHESAAMAAPGQARRRKQRFHRGDVVHARLRRMFFTSTPWGHAPISQRCSALKAGLSRAATCRSCCDRVDNAREGVTFLALRRDHPPHAV